MKPPILNESAASDSQASFSYEFTPGTPEFIESLESSLLVSTYQAGKLAVIRSCEDRLSMLLRTFQKAMGLAVGPDRLAIGTGHTIWKYWNSPSVANKLNDSDDLKSQRPFDACYLPRTAHITGAIDVHELAWGQDAELWLVNTHFSCLATLDERFSFIPRWRPPFVSALVREDRCHLNGLAMQAGRPKYVTCFAEADEAEGWRPRKLNGGCVIDVPTGETVARGLSMPHSPRLYDGRLWLLDSGRGELVTVDQQTGRTETVVRLPAFTRGLAFAGRYALVGLSQIRETAVFGGVPVGNSKAERPCGVAVVDIEEGRQVGLIEFLGDINEVFDVALLPNARWPNILRPDSEITYQSCVAGPARAIDEYTVKSLAESPM